MQQLIRTIFPDALTCSPGPAPGSKQVVPIKDFGFPYGVSEFGLVREKKTRRAPGPQDPWPIMRFKGFDWSLGV